jgi:hypothetical protein
MSRQSLSEIISDDIIFNDVGGVGREYWDKDYVYPVVVRIPPMPDYIDEDDDDYEA